MDALEIIQFKPVPSVVPGEQGLHFAVPLSTLRDKAKLVVDSSTFLSAVQNQVIPHGQHLEAKLAGHAVKDFVFKGWQDGPAGYMTAMFHRLLTARESSTEQRTLSGPAFSMERPWPNVLVYLAALEDPDSTYVMTIGGEEVEVQKLFDRVYLVPQGTYSSPVRREVYVSTTGNFAPALLETDVPVPGRLQWAHRNLRGGVNCLHPRCVFEETQRNARKLMNWGTVQRREPGSAGRLITIPATNHVTWQEHCFDVNVQRSDDGQWVLTRLVASPPKGFKAVREIT